MSENNQKLLQIGELSKQTGVAVSALRYYEEVNLLQPSYRNDSKYRFYLPSDVALVNFIKKSKGLGFTLEEIKSILNERDKGRSPCPVVRSLAKSKIKDLQKKVDELKKLEKELKNYIVEASSELESGSSDSRICGLIDNADKR
tara:strand:+ start:155 stop:586 length:432 start_codon:yes stop_codon:yes gene_type:complete